ncbi:MAG: SURF1 family protein [Thiobacillus sp.]|nr:SURF1 family protein [Thiobacillus sp.]
MHLLKPRLGKWVFAPTAWPTLAAAVFFALTMWLGNWQSERAEYKRGLQAQYDQAVAAPVVELGSGQVERGEVLHRRVAVTGEFDDTHTVYLDNRVHNGVAGYHVLTPLKIVGGHMAILVNRGWVATGRSRSQLPAVQVPRGRIRLEGMATDPDSRYVELAAGTSQGRVWQNLDFARYQAIYGAPLQPVLLLQATDTGDGLVRDWPRPDTGVSMHTSYAIQWYSLAATLVILWLGLNVKRHQNDDQ